MHGDDADLDATTNTQAHRSTNGNTTADFFSKITAVVVLLVLFQPTTTRGARETPRILLWCTGSTRAPPGVVNLLYNSGEFSFDSTK